MDNQYIRNLRVQKRSVGKRLYAAVCLMLVASLLLTTTSFAWLTLSQAPEVTDVATTLGANGNLEIALNTNSIDSYVFSANENTSIGIESMFEKNSYWGNVVDLSDERYGLQSIELKPSALNYKSDSQLAVNMGAPFLIAEYGVDGRITNVGSAGVLTNFDGGTNRFVSSTNYGVRALAEARKALSTLTVDLDQDEAVLTVYSTYKAIAEANSPEVSYQDWPAWRENVWNILLRIYFTHSNAIARGTTGSEVYSANIVNELEAQYQIMQENIADAYTYLQAVVICRVFADSSNIVAQAKIADLIANNEGDVRKYFTAAGITDYNVALNMLDETRDACNGVLNAITDFKTSTEFSSGTISYDQIRNLLLSDLDLNSITFDGNAIGAYDLSLYSANQYAWCLLNKTTTLDSLYGNPSYNFSTGSGLNFMSALESIHTVAMYEYAEKIYYDGYTMTIPSYANNEELRGITYETFMNPHNGHVRHLSWAYPYLTDSTNRGTSTNTEFYKQAYADAKSRLLEAFYIPEDPNYSAFITPAFDHIISVANNESDTYSYEYLARLEASLDALSEDFLNQYGEGIKCYALMFAALISDAECAEGSNVTEPSADSLYAKVLRAINEGKSADYVLAISEYLDYVYNVGNPPNNYYFKNLIGTPYAYMRTAIANAYARIDTLKATKSPGESLTWSEIYSIIVYIIGEEFAPYNGEEIEYANDRANCSIVLDVPSKAIGNIHTLFNSQNYACDFTLDELGFSANTSDPFMDRLILQKAGILPEKMTYGICIYRWDIPGGSNGNLELNPNGTTYAFGIDLLFRTNASAANLLLQTIGIDRIYNNNDAPEDWVYSDEYYEAQGLGSSITMENADLLSALRVAFVDTATGEIFGIAKADPNGYLYLSNDDGSATIKSLHQNVISAVTVWIYLDGNIVENLHADTAAATDMKINLQFSTDATLNPAYSGNSETPNGGGTQTPTTPSVPSNPDSGEEIVEYDVFISGKQVTSANANDILGDGTVSYNPLTNTLRLNGATITGSSTNGSSATYGIFSSGILNIELGENESILQNCHYGIETHGNLSISGGHLTIQNATIMGIYTNQNDATINGGNITINMPQNSNHAICTGSVDGTLTINDGNVILHGGETSTGDMYGLASLNIVLGNNAHVIASGGIRAAYSTPTLASGATGKSRTSENGTFVNGIVYNNEHYFEFVGDGSNFDIPSGPEPTIIASGNATDTITWTVSNDGFLRFAGNGLMSDYRSDVDVPWYAYSNEIKSVEIGEGITYLGMGSLASIAYEQITIPKSMAGIASHNGWTAPYKTVNYAGSERQWNAIAIYDASINATNSALINGTIIPSEENATLKNSGIVSSSKITWELYDDGILILKGSGKMPDWTENSAKPWDQYISSIKAVVMDEGIENVGSYAFNGCNNLESVKIAASVDVIGAYAFNNCQKLVAAAVAAGTQLEKVEDYAFANCYSLGFANIPGSVLSLGEAAFMNCGKLGYITLENITIIRNTTFFGCESLTSVELPDGLVSIGSYAFARCFGLKNITLPSTLMSIGYGAIYTDSTIDIYYGGSTTQWEQVSVDALNMDVENANMHYAATVLSEGNFSDDVFWSFDNAGTLSIYGTGDMPGYITREWDNSDLRRVHIYEGITSIGTYAFEYSGNLTTVVIPSSITHISWYAFEECTSPIVIYVTCSENEFTLTGWSGEQPDNITFRYAY